MLVDLGFIPEETVAQALARQLSLQFVNLKLFNFSRAVVLKLPEAAARRFRALALEDRGTTMLVGMADPTDLFAFDELTRILKKDVEAAVVAEGEVLLALDQVYRRTDEISGHAKELEQDMGGDNLIDFGALGAGLGAEDAPVVKLLQSLFEDATQVGASDIHIEPQEESPAASASASTACCRCQTEADARIASALVLRLKLMSGLDISEKRLPQDGRFNVARARAAGRRAHLDHADAVRRIGGDAPAQPEQPACSASSTSACRPAMLERFRAAHQPRRTAWCWSPVRPAAARPPRCTPR